MSYPTRAVVLSGFLLATACAHRAPAASAAAPAGFVCTQVMGVSVTADWFGAGFEEGLDGSRWQAVTRQHAFVQLWADPKSDLWSIPPVSPCAARAGDPDRVLFTAVNWEYKTADEWAAALEKVVGTLRQKYPGLRRIELLTMLRGPGNATCGDPRSVVQPFVDEAVTRVASAHPDIVRVGPKLEAPCDLFLKGGPHFVAAAMPAVARIYRAHYTAEH
jgi:hypothetical protein